MIDWYYLKSLPDTSPKRYNTLILFSQGFSLQEISEIEGVHKDTPKHALEEVRKLSGAKTNAHLIHLAHTAGIL